VGGVNIIDAGIRIIHIMSVRLYRYICSSRVVYKFLPNLTVSGHVGKISRRWRRRGGNCFGKPPVGEIRFQAHLFLITFLILRGYSAIPRPQRSFLFQYFKKFKFRIKYVKCCPNYRRYFPFLCALYNIIVPTQLFHYINPSI
jgi:hypothetical protein